jgi:hypothetical protein
MAPPVAEDDLTKIVLRTSKDLVLADTVVAVVSREEEGATKISGFGALCDRSTKKKRTNPSIATIEMK